MVAADPAAGCRKPEAAGVSFRLGRGEEQGVSALHGQRVLLGVSGGIAAYKSAELVRRLREAGAEVRVVMTAGAEHFITATTLQAVSGHPVRSSLWDAAAEAAMGHIELARWATRVLIAPATADLLARLAQGRADDLLATLCLATEAPLAVAPAMNRLMWANPATQANLALLRQRGVAVFGPDAGDQACGEVGEGRMREPAALVADLAGVPAAAGGCGERPSDATATAPRRLAGCRVLVSAGPTFEDIDPVRFLGNRSSGRMGFAVAEAAAAAGAEVTLVAGPVKLPTPPGVVRIDVRSAAEMHAAVLSALPGQDAYVGAAAVADYRPVEVTGRKIKKAEGPVELRLERTADILAEVAAHPQRPRCVLGFAAETHDVETYARGKLAAKRLDAIAANRVGLAGQGFDSEDNALTLYWDGGERDFGPAPKAAIARGLVDWIAEWLARA
jgi:phosphopantothenoylcysteine decarboxylase/phosphopantothenate--cysteine ligase